MSEKVFETLRAIQLVSVETRELYIRLNGPIEKDLASLDMKEIKLGSAHTIFDQETKTIHVGLRLSLGMEEKPVTPVSMRIEVLGTFTVDTEKFPAEQINDWADKNAPIILYPFVREHGFGLTSRCGMPPIILPLLQVPTLQTGNGKPACHAATSSNLE